MSDFDQTPAKAPASVFEMSDRALLERAVRTAQPLKRRESEPRWASVQRLFALGSTFSIQLCRQFGVDPHEYRQKKR